MKKLLAVVLALSMVLVFFAVRPAPASAAGFPDVPANYWAKKYIDTLVSKGVVKGFPDGTFKPEAKVTREQFAKMIVAAKGLKLYKPSTPTFTDVSKSRWSYGYVEAAVKAGYIKGYGNGKFGPADPITREQLATLMVRVLGLEGQAKQFKTPIVFTNDWKDISKWAAGYVTVAVRPDVQVLLPRKGVLIAPKSPATRAECAHAVYKGVIVPPKQGGQVKIVIEQEPDTLFDLASDMLASSEIYGFTESGCVSRWPDGTLYPGVDTLNIPNLEDGTLVVNKAKKTMKTVFHFRPGAKWNDGVPINYKEDLEYGVSLILSGKIPNLPSTDPYDKIDHIEWPDPYTAVIYWKQTTINYYSGASALYPKHAYGKLDPSKIASSKYAQYPITDGPYKVTSWVEGSHITLEPNPYWIGWRGGKPLIQKFVFTFFTDSNTMMMNMISGQADVALFGLGPEQMLSIQRAHVPNLVAKYITSTAWEHWEFNLDDPILKDKLVREALSHAVNKQDIIDKVYYGTRTVADNFILPGTVDYNPNVKIGGYDPKLAGQLLDKAGWKLGSDGFRYKDGKRLTIEIATTTRADRQKSVTLEVGMLKAVGIDAKAKFLSGSYLFGTYIPQGKFQVTEFAWVGAPGEDFIGFFAPSLIPTKENNFNGYNYSHMNVAEMEKLYQITMTDLNEENRIKAFKRAQEIVADVIPIVPLNFYTDPYVWNKHLEMAFFDYSISSSIVPTYNGEYWYWDNK